MEKFGVLVREDPRKVWESEPARFTPWLAAHLDLLGSELGFDLERRQTEAPVGDFSLDILARDVGSERLVIIENQLTATDHDHLGKLLTYASGYDARVVIWVAPEFREEHRQALDWLNQHTDTETQFFGVIIEVLRIDDSLPAPHFRLIAVPNEWRKRKVGTTDQDASERERAYKGFFQLLIDELRDKHHFTSARIAQPQNWYAFSSGNSSIYFYASFAQAGRCRAEIRIETGDKSENKRLYDAVCAEKGAIETEFGEPLTWERLDDRQASRIAVYRPGKIDLGAAELEQLRGWFVDRLLRLKQVYQSRIEKLIV